MNTEYPTSSPGDMSSRTTFFPSSDSLEKVMTASFLNEAHRACFAFFYYRDRAGLDDGFNTLTATRNRSYHFLLINNLPTLHPPVFFKSS